MKKNIILIFKAIFTYTVKNYIVVINKKSGFVFYRFSDFRRYISINVVNFFAFVTYKN